MRKDHNMTQYNALTLEQAQKMMDARGNLDLSGTGITSLPDNLTVGGGLYLRGTGITSLPDNLTVGGSLDLSGTRITSLPDNLTVGGWLYLSGTGITSLPDNLTVGGGLYLSGTGIAHGKYNRLKNGDYVPGRYIYVDGILTHVKRKCKKSGYTFYVGRIPGRNVIYDGTHYAHCKKFSEGVADLQFKAAKDRGADQYRDLTLDSRLTADGMITMYRVITGACQQGTKQFVESLGELEPSYTVREAIELTKGQYNARCFEDFFTKDKTEE